MSITSDEINFLVYRYLQESGFIHSSFTFAYESLVAKSSVARKQLPPGALINLLQKGLQYLDIESRLNEDDVAVSKSASSSGEVIASDAVTTLTGHTSEVFICKWNPKADIIASGSGDSSARLWTVPKGASGVPSGHLASASPIVLNHFGPKNESSKDVTTLGWNRAGTKLATGSYDGFARVWSAQGERLATLAKHKGPIFALKWNPSGNLLLSGSVDKTAIVWDSSTGKPLSVYSGHTKPTLDVDWKDNRTFATCSADRTIRISNVDSTDVVKTFTGHTDEVNAIKWDPSGNLLVSASDDFSAKVWSMDSDKPVHDFKGHSKEIYTVRWSPTGPGSDNPEKPLLLASGSFDSTIKLWDIATGKCTHTLRKHSHPIYAIAFSPNGDFVASGSFDQFLNVWSVKDGSLVRSFRGGGGIFDVDWNADGSKICASFSNNTVAIVDFKY